MSKPYKHAQSSAETFGGIPDDYLEIHKFMDSSKVAIADPRHRAVFHSAFGCFVVEFVFGEIIINSDYEEVSTRDIAEQHIIEDLGFVPTLEKWFEKMPIESWMSLHLQPKTRKEVEEEMVEDIKKKLEKIEGDPISPPETAPYTTYPHFPKPITWPNPIHPLKPQWPETCYQVLE